MAARRVNIGSVKGETPKKGIFFYLDDVPSNIEIATPERDGALPQKGALRAVSKFIDTVATEAKFSSPEKPATPPSSNVRPTTSRGKARPSPEEMFDYVVPSPDRRDRSQLDRVASMLVFEDSNQEQPEEPKETVSPFQQRKIAQDAAQKLQQPARVYKVAQEYDDSDSTDSGSQMDASEASQLERSERLAALGCWLFGSALSV